MKNLIIIIAACLATFTISCKSNVDPVTKENSVETVTDTEKKVKTLHIYRKRTSGDELVSIQYFDEEGKLTKTTGFVGDGEIYHTYTYDDKGNEVEEVYTDSEKKFKRVTTTIYSYDGNQIEKLVSMEDDGKGTTKKIMEEIFEYNDKGEVSKKKSIGEYYTNEYEFSYFPNGEIKQKTDISDEGDSKSVLDYNEMGDVIKQELFSRSPTSKTFELNQTNTWTFNDDTVDAETIEDGKVTFKNTTPRDKNLRKEYTYYE